MWPPTSVSATWCRAASARPAAGFASPPRLVEATTGQQVWAQTYDRDYADVFVQDEISEAIDTSLVGDLQHAEHERAARLAPEHLEAWELYHRALPLLHRFTRQDSAEARAVFERAVALAPRFSTAYARLAEAGIWQVMHEWTATAERTLAEAIDHARHAVDLDARDAYAHAMLAFALMTAGDAPRRRAEPEHAVRAGDRRIPAASHRTPGRAEHRVPAAGPSTQPPRSDGVDVPRHPLRRVSQCGLLCGSAQRGMPAHHARAAVLPGIPLERPLRHLGLPVDLPVPRPARAPPTAIAFDDDQSTDDSSAFEVC